jgi:hypothetical protein
MKPAIHRRNPSKKQTEKQEASIKTKHQNRGGRHEKTRERKKQNHNPPKTSKRQEQKPLSSAQPPSYAANLQKIFG